MPDASTARRCYAMAKAVLARPGDLACLLNQHEHRGAIAAVASNLGKRVQRVEEVCRCDDWVCNQAGADEVDGQVCRQAAAVGSDHAHQLSIQLWQVEQLGPHHHLAYT